MHLRHTHTDKLVICTLSRHACTVYLLLVSCSLLVQDLSTVAMAPSFSLSLAMPAGAAISPAASAIIAYRNVAGSSSTVSSQLGRFSSSEIFAVKLVAAPSRRLCCSSVLDDSSARGRVAVCKLAKGDRIPPATLKDQDGRKVSLSKFKGRPLVLYFYPADESQGCTKQACSFRDSYEQFKKAGAEVVGVSGDSPESHKKFKAKYRLPYTLLSDEGNTLRKEFGVPPDFFGALAGRQTYVTDRQGVVQLIYNNQFQPEKHIQETLKFLQG
ncbi:hypothetical protein BDL97_05G122400 [Sphagnum fallax]|nr:hypothetical protein BDL97_05G122400 [Sphagnum fallax]KAH8962842.1 hypothetical protein BDL97_05G122400 [Sphagnum fallax]